MEKAEIIKKLHEEFKEELEGVKDYHEMAEYALGLRDNMLAKHLRKISRDEFTHASYIYEILEENGVTLSDTEKSLWNKMQGMMKL